MFRLDGKSVFLTGGASGIGARIAVTFARAGAQVILGDLTPADGVLKEIEEAGGHATPVNLDVSNEAACHEVAERVGPVDIVVNNAGIGHVGTALETTAADLDRLYAVNVRGVFNVSRAFLPSLITRGGGSIINLASIGGIVGIRDRLAYCATKFAVVGLTKSMALDHAVQGVRVNCICPGRVETPFVKARLAEYPDPEKAYAEMSATQALGRMAQPEEIAAAALYLASDEAAFVTGSALIIDGGWSAGK